MSSRTTRTSGAWLDALLSGAAVLAVTAWTLQAPTGGPVVPLAVFGALAVVTRLVEPHRGLPPLAAVFTGAGALLGNPLLAVWATVAVAVTGVVREGLGTRRHGAAHVLAIVVAALAARLGDGWFAGQRLITGVGSATIGVRTALLVGLVLAAAWIVADRLAGASRDEETLTPLREVAIGAAAVLTAVIWVAAPLLVMLVLLVLAAIITLAGPPTGEATGPWAGAALHELGTRAIERAARAGEPLALLVVELQGPASDDLLEQAFARVRDAVGGAGIVAPAGPRRVGAVLVAADALLARQVASRLTAAVGQLDGRLTTAVGIASYPGDGRDVAALLTEAALAAAYATLEGPGAAAAASALPSGFHRGASPTGARRELGVGRRADRLVRAAAVPLVAGRPGTDRLLAGVAIAGAVAVATAVVLDPRPPAWPLVLVLAGLAVLAEATGTSIEGRLAVSWSAVPLVAVGVLAGHPGAGSLTGVAGGLAVTVPCLLAGTVGGLVRRVRSRQLIFNTAVLVVATFAAAGIARLLDPVTPGTGLGDLAVSGLVAGVGFFVVDTAFVVIAVAFAGDEPMGRVWSDELRWLAPHQLGLAVLAGITAFAALHVGWAGAVLVAVPAAGLAAAQHRLVRDAGRCLVRMRAASDEAGDVADRLTAVNDRLAGALSRVNEGYVATLETLAQVVAERVSPPNEAARRETFGRRLLEAVEPTLLDDQAIRWAFRLHDIGMITAPDELLHKRGPLEADEIQLLREHARIGADLIARAPFLERARPTILHHHERWDGGGYPFGLSGEAIPLPARVLAVVDAYVAMTSPRHHRGPLTADEAIEELVRGAGSTFDPAVIEAFLHLDRSEAEDEARRASTAAQPSVVDGS